MAITVNHDIAYPSSYGTLNNELGFVGKIENELQLFDVQIQIAKEKATGYYIEWNDQHIDISETGELSKWPSGYGDHAQRAFVELLGVRGLGGALPESGDWRHND